MTTSRSDDNLDLFRDSPQRQAELWRTAAETCRQQFPNDTQRLAYYLSEAERLEKVA